MNSSFGFRRRYKSKKARAKYKVVVNYGGETGFGADGGGVVISKVPMAGAYLFVSTSYAQKKVIKTISEESILARCLRGHGPISRISEEI